MWDSLGSEGTWRRTRLDTLPGKKGEDQFPTGQIGRVNKIGRIPVNIRFFNAVELRSALAKTVQLAAALNCAVQESRRIPQFVAEFEHKPQIRGVSQLLREWKIGRAFRSTLCVQGSPSRQIAATAAQKLVWSNWRQFFLKKSGYGIVFMKQFHSVPYRTNRLRNDAVKEGALLQAHPCLCL